MITRSGVISTIGSLSLCVVLIKSDQDEDDDEQECEHLILCQYEKVTRVKNKW
jgi:hypothetical protein